MVTLAIPHPRGNGQLPATEMSRILKGERFRVGAGGPKSALRQTLKRNSTTSPSFMTYCLPSMRTFPATLAADMLPAATRSS
jgi:hypothetical protein